MRALILKHNSYYLLLFQLLIWSCQACCLHEIIKREPNIPWCSSLRCSLSEMIFYPISVDPNLEWFLVGADSASSCLSVASSSSATAKLGIAVSVKEKVCCNNSICCRRVTLAPWDQYVVVRSTIGKRKKTRIPTVCVKPDDSSSDTIRNRHAETSDSCRCEVADGAVLTVVPDSLSFVSSLYSLGLPHTDRVVLVSQVNSPSIVVVKSLNLISILSEVL